MQIAPSNLSTRVRDLVDRLGVFGAARELDVARETIARLTAGLPVRPGTVLLVAVRLDEREAAIAAAAAEEPAK